MIYSKSRAKNVWANEATSGLAEWVSVSEWRLIDAAEFPLGLLVGRLQS